MSNGRWKFRKMTWFGRWQLKRAPAIGADARRDPAAIKILRETRLKKEDSFRVHDPLCGGAWRCKCDGPTCERSCPAEMFCQCALIAKVRTDQRHNDLDIVANFVWTSAVSGQDLSRLGKALRGVVMDHNSTCPCNESMCGDRTLHCGDDECVCACGPLPDQDHDPLCPPGQRLLVNEEPCVFCALIAAVKSDTLDKARSAVSETFWPTNGTWVTEETTFDNLGYACLYAIDALRDRS